MVATIGQSGEVPHVWHTTDEDGGDCRHLAMCEEGAIQAHLLHHGMMGYSKTLTATDEGRINANTERGDICFDPNDTLYALSFPEVKTGNERGE